MLTVAYLPAGHHTNLLDAVLVGGEADNVQGLGVSLLLTVKVFTEATLKIFRMLGAWRQVTDFRLVLVHAR